MVKVFDVYRFDTPGSLVRLGLSAFTPIKSPMRDFAADDRELSEEVRQSVITLVNNCGFCCGIHDLVHPDLGGIWHV